MGALVLHEVPDCPQIQNNNIIWVQKGTHIELIKDAVFPEPSICLSNVPENKPPLGSPVEPLWTELPISRAFFNISKVPNKSSRDKKNFTLLSKAIGKEVPPHVPQNGAIMETDAHFQSLSVSFRVPSEGALPPGSPHRAPTERFALFPEPSSIFQGTW